jgi:hypothetical protein
LWQRAPTCETSSAVRLLCADGDGGGGDDDDDDDDGYSLLTS